MRKKKRTDLANCPYCNTGGLQNPINPVEWKCKTEDCPVLRYVGREKKRI